MKSLLCALFLLTSFSALAQIDVNELCLKANINSLKHLDLDHWDGENICDKPVSELTLEEKRNLEDIYDVHQKAADLFGITVYELFTYPIEVDMLETTLGGLASSAGGRSINMGVYPKSDYTFNKGIYAHELGHVLSGMGNKKLPSSFSDLDDSILFTEMFADLISLALFDQIIIPVKGEESCIDRARYIARGQTYNMPIEYFLSDFSMARVAKCCESSTMKEAHPFVLGLCEEVNRMGDWKVKLSTPFDAEEIIIGEVDNHQIGIPLLSFLKEDIFRLGFNHAIPRHEEFFCKVSYKDEVLFEKNESRNTVRTFLVDLRESLSFVDQMTYDLLSSKHALEKGLQFGDRDNLESLYDMSTSDFNSQVDEKHVCAKNFAKRSGTSEQCVLTCQKN
jgi:hypothetical protein